MRTALDMRRALWREAAERLLVEEDLAAPECAGAPEQPERQPEVED